MSLVHIICSSNSSKYSRANMDSLFAVHLSKMILLSADKIKKKSCDQNGSDNQEKMHGRILALAYVFVCRLITCG